jgi:hypothetical protein
VDSGGRGIELFRRDPSEEVEFVTMMTFDSLQNVIDFQGEEYARCDVPDTAKKVRKRWDPVSAHYDLGEERKYC